MLVAPLTCLPDVLVSSSDVLSTNSGASNESLWALSLKPTGQLLR